MSVNRSKDSGLIPQALERMYEIMGMKSVDLHIHTTHSDGYESPGTVVQNVIRHGLAAFSITDRDTTQAIVDVYRILHKLDLIQLERPVFVPGVEVSAEYEGRDVDILAYFPYGGEYRLDNFLLRQQENRIQRNRLMCEKLEAMGCPITYEGLRAIGGTVIGREHMATILVREGQYPTVDVCFDELLAFGKPAFVPRPLDTLEEVLQTLRQVGGIPVLANPFFYPWFTEDYEVLLKRFESLKAMGLEGIETVHSDATDEDMETLANIGRELNLLRTAGSDIHVTSGPGVRILRSELNYSRFLE